MQKEYESYLAHYGVRGMRWGVRKAAPKVSNNKKRKNNIYNKKLSSLQKTVLKNRLGGSLTSKAVQKKLKDYAAKDAVDFWTNIPAYFEEAGYTFKEAEKVLEKIIK